MDLTTMWCIRSSRRMKSCKTVSVLHRNRQLTIAKSNRGKASLTTSYLVGR
jgi:hypothetical protein